MSNKSYRVVLFDRNNIRPNIEIIVRDVETIGAAKAAASAKLHRRAEADIRLITNGMMGTFHDVPDTKGTVSRARVLTVSPEYYQYLVDECWGIADVMQIEGVSKGVSSERTVEATAHKEQPTKRRRRWSKAQKAAAKAARTINGQTPDTKVKVSYDDPTKLVA